MGSGFGYGHWIAPDFHPSGNVHWIFVGSPESPGFFQYVCQCGTMRSCKPTVIGLPGCAAVFSARSCASTRSVFTVGAAMAAIGRASSARALRWLMLWIKTFHIVFVVSWFAGLFYLPRLFVYHAMAEDAATREHFKVMERKLYRG